MGQAVRAAGVVPRRVFLGANSSAYGITRGQRKRQYAWAISHTSDPGSDHGNRVNNAYWVTRGLSSHHSASCVTWNAKASLVA